MYPTKMHRRIISVLLSFVILASLTIGASAAYGPYDITFTGAVDATTRWGSPVTTGPSSYPSNPNTVGYSWDYVTSTVS